MTTQQRIALITIDQIISDAFSEQLQKIFGDRVIIKKLKLDQFTKSDLADCQLVLCSSKIIYDRVKDITPGGIKVITVKRAINLENVSALFQLEPGQAVIVVSNRHFTAVETIKLLQELGIDHLSYRPYYPGCAYRQTDVAITPGGVHLVPPELERVIDLGVKLIDVSTLIEIILALQLPLNNTNFLIARYAKKLVELNKYSSQLNMFLEGMLATSHDGIIALNEENRVMYINKMAEHLLNITRQESVNRELAEVIADHNLGALFRDNRNRVDKLISYQNKFLLMNKKELKPKSIFNLKVISLKDVTQIQQQEFEIRKKMRKKGFVAKYSFADIIGISPSLRQAVKISKKIADNDLTVLIKGESGTGKELFAQAIHNKSYRCKKPFIAVNFAALSNSLVESELFGYEEGAFTGARKGGKAGLFEQAHTGTIFIDEIGDASLALQARLLRVLQEKEVMRIGSNNIIPVDVRVIVATHRDLEQLVEDGRFRRDLYYRLKVLYFTVPALRNRPEDIYYLVNYFLKRANSSKDISDEVYRIFREHNWPGNVRELENICNYIVNIVEETVVKPEHLPEEFRDKGDFPDTSGKNRLASNQDRSNECNVILAQLKNFGMPEEFIPILRILNQARFQEQKLGRNRIAEKARTQDLRITQDMVRYRLKKLAEVGLVHIGKKRQGSRITEKGIKVLKYLGE